MERSNQAGLFAVYRVADDADREFPAEPMGARRKFSFTREGDNGRWMFKESRAPVNGHPSGEHWSEVVAAVLAAKLGLPHAEYQLASFRGNDGVVTRSFVGEDEILQHGNELLSGLDPEYPRRGDDSYKRCKRHTLKAIAFALATYEVQAPERRSDSDAEMNAYQVFEGYLLLDAWIGNTDRHHENWAVHAGIGGVTRLSPTYDHASSLGANLEDADRTARLDSPDPNHTAAGYAGKARSRFWSDTEKKFLLTVDALTAWRRFSPTDVWLDRLERITDEEMSAVVNRIPSTTASDAARRFATAMLRTNKKRILEIR